MRAVYGPVPSWRLGLSLGVDLLLPPKTCTFNCVYCQLGRTARGVQGPWEVEDYVKPEELRAELAKVDREVLNSVDWVTISGTGEPTLNPELSGAVKAIREVVGDKRLAVLTNSSLLHLEEVRRALDPVDLVVAKLDAASNHTFTLVNRPIISLGVERVVEGIRSLVHERGYGVAAQVMLLEDVNDGEEHLRALAERLRSLDIGLAYLSIPSRPPSESHVKPPPSYKVDLAKRVFEEAGVKVKAFTEPAEMKSRTGLDEERALELIRRRPCRALDLVLCTGASEKEVIEVLERLVKKGLAAKKVYRGITFYEAAKH